MDVNFVGFGFKWFGTWYNLDGKLVLDFGKFGWKNCLIGIWWKWLIFIDFDGKYSGSKFNGKKNGFGLVFDGTVEDFDSDFGDFHGKIYISKFDGNKNGFGWVLDGTVENFDLSFRIWMERFIY